MAPAHYHDPAGREAPPLRRRLTAVALALAVEALLVLVLLALNGRPDPKAPKRPPLSFDLIPAPEKQGGPAPEAAKEKAAPPRAARRADTPAPPRVTPPPPPPPLPSQPAPAKELFPDLIRLDNDQFKAADIAGLKAPPGAAGKDTSKDSAAIYGPGAGPGGEPLYNADWVREPTDAELNFYLPPVRQSGWALIACKTAPRNRVENCRTMGESPIGSGLSRGFREAAWQFRIYPPRIGGKPLIGVWVRIYYELKVTPAKP